MRTDWWSPNVHIRDHEHQSLRWREGGTKDSTYKGSVKSSHGSSLRLESRASTTSYLHLNYLYTLSKYILTSLNGPGVAMLSHGRWRCNGENDSRLRHVVGRGGGSFVTITSNTHRHWSSSKCSGSSNSVKGISPRDSRSCRSQQILQHLRRELRLWGGSIRPLPFPPFGFHLLGVSLLCFFDFIFLLFLWFMNVQSASILLNLFLFAFVK